MNQPRKVAILGGNRIPFARSNKEYAKASNQDMLTSALNGLVARYGLQDQEMGLVVGGAVLKHARDFNLVRESVLGSELASTTPAFDLQHACGTSLTSAIQVADAIALGRIENGIACGADTTSDAPLAVNDTLRKTLIRLSNAKSVKDQLKLAGSIRPNQLAPEQPQNGEPRTGLSMGDHAAITAREMEISREEQDELAATSHQNLAKAYEENFFDDLMTPFLGVNRDTNLRPDSTVEKLSKLKPVFGKKDAEQHGGTATMTAGNSTPLTDGAAAVLLSSEEWAKEQNLPVRAYLVDSELAAVDFVSGKDGLLMAPTYAVPRLLERNGLTLQDFDFYEIHEAFASQVLATLKAWEDETYCRERLGLDAPLGSIDRSKLNVKGSSLAAGHPFAATGGRIVAALAKMLRQKADETGKTTRGLISVCAAGGQGVVAVLEARV